MATSAAYIDHDEAAAPATPAAGKVRIYAKTDGLLYSKDDAGTETLVSAGAGLSNPMTTAEDIIVGGASGTPARLAKGTDDQVLTMVSGAVAWAAAAGGAGPEELAYVEFTSTVSPTSTGGTPLTEANTTAVVSAGAVVFDGSTAIKVCFYSNLVRGDSAGGSLSLFLFDGTASIGRLAFRGNGASNAGTGPVYVESPKFTPSAASHTYSVRAIVSAGTGAISAGSGGTGPSDSFPGYIQIVTVP